MSPIRTSRERERAVVRGGFTRREIARTRLRGGANCPRPRATVGYENT